MKLLNGIIKKNQLSQILYPHMHNSGDNSTIGFILFILISLKEKRLNRHLMGKFLGWIQKTNSLPRYPHEPKHVSLLPGYGMWWLHRQMISAIIKHFRIEPITIYALIVCTGVIGSTYYCLSSSFNVVLFIPFYYLCAILSLHYRPWPLLTQWYLTSLMPFVYVVPFILHACPCRLDLDMVFRTAEDCAQLLLQK